MENVLLIMMVNSVMAGTRFLLITTRVYIFQKGSDVYGSQVCPWPMDDKHNDPSTVTSGGWIKAYRLN